MSKGKVKEYYPDRGCGSIIDAGSGQTLIVYANYLRLVKGDILKAGQEMEYDIETNRNEGWAVNVRFSVAQVEENKHAAA